MTPLRVKSTFTKKDMDFTLYREKGKSEKCRRARCLMRVCRKTPAHTHFQEHTLICYVSLFPFRCMTGHFSYIWQATFVYIFLSFHFCVHLSLFSYRWSASFHTDDMSLFNVWHDCFHIYDRFVFIYMTGLFSYTGYQSFQVYHQSLFIYIIRHLSLFTCFILSFQTCHPLFSTISSSPTRSFIRLFYTALLYGSFR